MTAEQVYLGGYGCRTWLCIGDGQDDSAEQFEVVDALSDFGFGRVREHKEVLTRVLEPLVGEGISYGTLLSALSPAEQALGRPINPTPYTLAEFRKRQQEQQYFKYF